MLSTASLSTFLKSAPKVLNEGFFEVKWLDLMDGFVNIELARDGASYWAGKVNNFTLLQRVPPVMSLKTSLLRQTQAWPEKCLSPWESLHLYVGSLPPRRDFTTSFINIILFTPPLVAPSIKEPLHFQPEHHFSSFLPGWPMYANTIRKWLKY